MARKRTLFFHRVLAVLKNPLILQNWQTLLSKSPRIGGFRGLSLVNCFLSKSPRIGGFRRLSLCFLSKSPRIGGFRGLSLCFLSKSPRIGGLAPAANQKRGLFLLALATTIACILISPGAIAISAANPVAQPAAQLALTRAQQFDQQGRSLYQERRFTEAAIAFQQAATAYETEGDPQRQAISLSNAALADQQLGSWTEAEQAIAQSLSLLETQEASGENSHLLALAQVLDTKGNLQLGQGNAQDALSTWQRTTALYEQLADAERVTEGQINQAQAFQSLGLYRRAIATLYTASGLEPLAPLMPDATRKPLQSLSSDELQTMLSQLPNSTTTIAALQSLGEALRVTGSLGQARILLEHSRTVAEGLQLPEAIAAAQLRLGNVARAQAFVNLSRGPLTLAKAVELSWREQRFDQICTVPVSPNQPDPMENFYSQIDSALDLYRQAAIASTLDQTRLQAKLNLLNLLVQTEKWSEIQTLPAQLKSQIEDLPISASSISARINLARNLSRLKRLDEEKLAQLGTPRCNQPFELPFTSDQSFQTDAAQMLAIAIQQSKALNNPRAESYALGVLGELYEQASRAEGDASIRTQQAQDLTRQALSLAQQLNASDIAYLWQWQLGRLLKQQGKTDEAIAAYKEAVNTLQTIRSDLVAINPEDQYSFRDTIEPIHRELVSLLLPADGSIPSAGNIVTARDVIESLQLAELDNFFREACLNAKPEQIDQVDDTAAVLYPIILSDRLAVIAKLPHQPLTYFTTSPEEEVTKEKLEATVTQLFISVTNKTVVPRQYLPLAQQLYNWLIRPVEARLVESEVKTLVFVLDGALRNIPMSVLHDGEHYLIEKDYGIALTPGLQLLESQPLVRDRLRALLAGSSTFPDLNLPPLGNVSKELSEIETRIPDNVVLEDQSFTYANLQTAISAAPFPIVHLATHGEFSSQLEDTYVAAWNERINIEQLRTLLQGTAIRQQGALELLVMSACKTAVGDNRAALGLAGMAVRSGARTTIATLWYVNDASSLEMMSQFYKNLTDPDTTPTKAEALRLSQLSLLQSPEFSNPYYWAPYVLVGNWR